MNKKWVLMFIVFLIAGSITADTGKDLLNNLKNEDKIKLATLLIPNSFLISKEYIEYKWTLNQFFTKKIYDELLGTPFTGYEYDEGFRFKGNEIEIESIKIISKFRETGYLNMFEKILKKMFLKNGLKFQDECRYKAGICIVNVNEEYSEDMIPWVWIEVFVRDSKEDLTYFLRYSVGSKKGLFEAMVFIVKRILIELEYHRGS